MERKTKQSLALALVFAFAIMAVFILVYVYQFEMNCNGCIKRGDCMVPYYTPECNENSSDDCLYSPVNYHINKGAHTYPPVPYSQEYYDSLTEIEKIELWNEKQ